LNQYVVVEGHKSADV